MSGQRVLQAIAATALLGGEILGIIPEELPQEAQESGLDGVLMEILIELRATARKNRDWTTARKTLRRIITIPMKR